MLGEIQDTCPNTEPLQPPLGGHGGPSHSEGQRGQTAGSTFSPWGPNGPQLGGEELGLSIHPEEGNGAIQGQGTYQRSAVSHRGPQAERMGVQGHPDGASENSC